MPDNKPTISVSTIEPVGNRRQDPVMGPAGWAQAQANADSQLAREYREAFLLIHKVRGQMKGLTVNGNSSATMVDNEVEEEPAPPLAGQVPPAMTFTELARRFSEQMEQVAATGKQITAASRLMASGIQDLNDGVGMLKRKLSRVKY